ncbi:enoyl-CoA hydratase/isomerase family protein [Halorussus caseinilyticus]|uniref:Enoyl-CoA hydratase/isomerase family protein n=1 Tax=Halorussus caseinilyticus TaxID=3034025 RepID=A0ABD5WVW4_9EURY|nr:enoyl-CoA hydratase/isomerase family protein [Halorussus sp. DT72]
MIRTQDDDGVRVVTLDRPDRRNALTPDGLDALEAAVTDASQPVVYLRGAGPAFCAGADLDVVAGLDREGAEAFAERGQRVADAIADADSAVVAGIDGAARGGGVELALAADLRVATPEATFAEPGVKLGLFGAWGGTVRLPRVVGEGEALDLALSGRTVDAESARRMGLVSRVTDDPRAVADELAANDPRTLRAVKARMRDDAPPETQQRREAEVFGELVARHADAIADRRES